MPTTPIPSKEVLVALSGQLKRRLATHRKGNLSPELRRDLLGALDQLAELAIEPTGQDAVQPPSSSTECSSFELSQVVAEAVATSLATWQSRFGAQLLEAVSSINSSSGAQPDELQSLLLQELDSELTETRRQLSLASQQLTESQAELANCQGQLEAAQNRYAELELESLHSASQATDIADQLKLQLEDVLDELAELREQNSDLATKLAQQSANALTNNQMEGCRNGQQMSWEERKLLILKQLEDDSSSCSTADLPNKSEIQEIIDTSQREIARRDSQIEELREIIRMQSDAKSGVAIGAAGVVQMLDTNELVQQEREKLREIQLEWESKLRQAEIDLSMERAKVARERVAMEKQKEELAQLQINNIPKEKNIERRWLRILGMSEKADD